MSSIDGIRADAGVLAPDGAGGSAVPGTGMLEALSQTVDAVVAADRMVNAAMAVRTELIERFRALNEVHDSLDASAGRSAAWQSSWTLRSTVAQLACALRIPEQTMTGLVTDAEVLVRDLPKTMQALGAGTISYRHACVMADQTRGLSAQATASCEQELLGKAGRLTVSKFRTVARRWRERHHPVDLSTRHREAVAERRVEFHCAEDGMAWLSALLPATQAQAIFHRISDMAVALRAMDAAGGGHQREGRTLPQRRADVLTDLLLDDAPESQTPSVPDDTATGGGGAVAGEATAVDVDVVVVDAVASAGGDDVVAGGDGAAADRTVAAGDPAPGTDATPAGAGRVADGDVASGGGAAGASGTADLGAAAGDSDIASALAEGSDPWEEWESEQWGEPTTDGHDSPRPGEDQPWPDQPGSDRPRFGLPPSLRGIRATVAVTVPVFTLLGLSQEPGDLAGYGPIDPDTARELAANAPSFIRILTHPETGAVLSVGRDRYAVPADLRTWLTLRDETCRHAGCNHRASRCDADHTRPWSQGGTTSHDNLTLLCPGHHQLKHHQPPNGPGWTYRQLDDGVLACRTPTGHVYLSEPALRIAATAVSNPRADSPRTTATGTSSPGVGSPGAAVAGAATGTGGVGREGGAAGVSDGGVAGSGGGRPAHGAGEQHPADAGPGRPRRRPDHGGKAASGSPAGHRNRRGTRRKSPASSKATGPPPF